MVSRADLLAAGFGPRGRPPGHLESRRPHEPIPGCQPGRSRCEKRFGAAAARRAHHVHSRPETPPVASASCEIVLAKGLTAVGGAKLTEEVKIACEARPTINLISLKHVFTSENDNGLLVTLSRGVKPTLFADAVRILPPIGRLQVRAVSSSMPQQLRITGKFAAGTTYTLELLPREIGDDGAVVLAERRTFTAVGPTPQIQFEMNRSVVERHSRQVLPISLVNIKSLRCQITRVPPFFAPEFSTFSLQPDADQRRDLSSDEQRLGASQESALAKAALEAEQRLVECVKRIGHLEQLAAPPTEGNPVLPFLGPFTSKSEAFLNGLHAKGTQRFSLPLSFRPEPAKGGTFLVQLSDPENTEVAQRARLIQVTDLSITYKLSGKELLVWVTSLEAAKPVAQAELMMIDKDDRRFLLGRTDAHGLLLAKHDQICQVVAGKPDAPVLGTAALDLTKAALLVAATADDSCFIEVSANRFVPFSIHQVDPGNTLELNRNGHVFTERGIYKQGETVFWKAAVRAYENHEIVPPAGQKVLLTVTNARDEMFHSEVHELNEFGTCSGSISVSSFAPLGNYTLSVTQVPADTTADPATKKAPPAEHKTLAQTSFQVQTFEPPRHFVTLANVQKAQTVTHVVGRPATEDYLETTITGAYYTGGPVRHAKVRWTARLAMVTHEVTAYDRYSFGSTDSQSSLIESGEATLDGDGKLVIRIPLDASVKGGLYGIELSATVLDVDARPATAVEVWKATPTWLVGIGQLPAKVYENDEVLVPIVVLDNKKQPVKSGKVRIEIQNRRWYYSYKRSADGDISYHWDQGWMKNTAVEQPIVDGKVDFMLVCGESGDFRMQVTFEANGTEFQSVQNFSVGYAYESFEDPDGRTRRRTDSEIVLTPSTGMAGVGDTVTCDFSLPRPAAFALVTCEHAGILEHRIIEVNGRRGSFPITIKPEFRPNVFITVTVPTGRSSLPLYRSRVDLDFPRIFYGYANVQIRTVLSGLATTIADEATGPGQSDLRGKPGQAKKIILQVTDAQGKPADAEVALAVVDEAVLALTGFPTPILNSLTRFVLPLAVWAGDLRLALITQELYRFFAVNPLTGGGMGAGAVAADMDLRKDFRPVAFWHPALRPDAEGRIVAEFTLPDTTTAYRVYAVALDRGHAFCSAQRNLVVSKDFFLQPGLPRFLVAGDEATCPVAASNKTDQPGTAQVRVTEADGVSAEIPKGDVELPGFTNKPVSLHLRADRGLGDARLVLSGNLGPAKDAIQQILPILPRYLPARRGKVGHFVETGEIAADFPASLKALPSPNERRRCGLTCNWVSIRSARSLRG
jgi:uncharacterized protein YfaS (alpha-2-macroglobulin family)